MHAAEFVDTNIWVYVHLDAPDDPRSERAWLFIHRLGRPVISVQVVAEYFNMPLLGACGRFTAMLLNTAVRRSASLSYDQYYRG